MAGAAMEQREFFGVFGEGDHGSRPKAFGSAGEVRCVSGVQGRIGYGARNCQEAMQQLGMDLRRQRLELREPRKSGQVRRNENVASVRAWHL